MKQLNFTIQTNFFYSLEKMQLRVSKSSQSQFTCQNIYSYQVDQIKRILNVSNTETLARQICNLEKFQVTNQFCILKFNTTNKYTHASSRHNYYLTYICRMNYLYQDYSPIFFLFKLELEYKQCNLINLPQLPKKTKLSQLGFRLLLVEGQNATSSFYGFLYNFVFQRQNQFQVSEQVSTQHSNVIYEYITCIFYVLTRIASTINLQIFLSFAQNIYYCLFENKQLKILTFYLRVSHSLCLLLHLYNQYKHTS
eukprot:TRINITY_DN1469_c1_g1_i10.p1 TRINITY_DN1469_c1_g1~~TRINITY_DN1469_c1_g1_i10.p1  ORF type:complete len:253 (+),score=-35.94 TRINITY_DN1469_c1_g1_i10:279-1037(+)